MRAQRLKNIEMPHAPLRDYQRKTIEELIETDESTIVHAATGSGKSIIMAYLVKYYAEQLNRKVVILIYGIQLIDQFARHLDKFGIDFGVQQGDHPRKKPEAPVQLCSIDTLNRRKDTPKADLVIVDEVHRMMGRSAVKAYDKLEARRIGFSATPYLKKGFEPYFTKVIKPIGFGMLVKEGFLVAPHYYSLPKIDFNALRIKRGEYTTKSMELATVTDEVFSGVLEEFLKHDKGKPALGFCVSIYHAIRMTAYFRAHGIKCDYIDHKMPLKKRNRLLDNLVKGKLRIVFNVETLTTGIDRPAIEMIMLCRPTRSLILYLQMLGRGTRPYPMKDHVTLLDFCGNVVLHGFMEEAPPAWLKPIPKIKIPLNLSNLIVCPQCGFTYRAVRGVDECPQCGHKHKKNRKKPDTDLVRYKPKSHIEILAALRKIARKGRDRGYRPGYVFYRSLEELGEDITLEYCPRENKEKVYELYAPLPEQLPNEGTNHVR